MPTDPSIQTQGIPNTPPSQQAAVPQSQLEQQAGMGREQQVVGGLMALVGQIDQRGQSPGEKWQMLKAALTQLQQSGQQQQRQQQPINYAGSNPTVRQTGGGSVQ